MKANTVRLLYASVYNMANFLRTLTGSRRGRKSHSMGASQSPMRPFESINETIESFSQRIYRAVMCGHTGGSKMRFEWVWI
jgi:hypothetical protein